MRVLITGGTGLLGKALIQTGRGGNSIWALYLGGYRMADEEGLRYFNFDVCDPKALEDLFCQASPEVVIHTAGIASVDFCEANYDQAWHSNVYGTRVVAGLCRKYRARIVFISTNAVFDGESPPYSEENRPRPINNYGRIKLECEGIIRDSGLPAIIARPIIMYGWNNERERPNPATWLMEKLKKGEKVNIVDDVYENFLFNLDCARTIWLLIKSDKKGIYHIAGRDVVNRYEFAKIVAEVFGLPGDLIQAVSSDFFPGLAPRPRNTSYNTAKVERELGIKPLGIREGLLLMRKDAGLSCPR